MATTIYTCRKVSSLFLVENPGKSPGMAKFITERKLAAVPKREIGAKFFPLESHCSVVFPSKKRKKKKKKKDRSFKLSIWVLLAVKH